MAYKCPHCDTEIDRMNYREDGTIYGTYDIETDDYEQEDTEAQGNLKYSCPNCDEDIDSVEDLIDTEEPETATPPGITGQFRLPLLHIQVNNTLNDITEEERSLPVPPAIDSDWRGEYSGHNNAHNPPKNSAILTCPHCNNKNEAMEGENIECYNCGKEVNRSNAKKIIEIEKPNRGFF